MPCLPRQRFSHSELSLGENISSELVKAFLVGNFEKIEEFYNIYRHRTSRTPDGRWKLPLFYGEFSLINLNNEVSWRQNEEQILNWIKAYPKSPAPYIVYSNFLITRAWSFRGGGFAEEVTPEAWKLFKQNIKLARATLEKNQEVASLDPEWYANMLTIAKLQGWSKREVKNLLHEALSKEPYYLETYYKVFSYLLPKWSGSFEEAEQFVDDVVAVTKKCEGRGMYARIYWIAFSREYEFNENPFAPAQINWKKMREGFEDIMVRYPDAWNLNNYAKFACLARDKEKARALINKIGSKPLIEAWDQDDVNFTNCQKWALEP
jgi:hypothetical protein